MARMRAHRGQPISACPVPCLSGKDPVVVAARQRREQVARGTAEIECLRPGLRVGQMGEIAVEVRPLQLLDLSACARRSAPASGSSRSRAGAWPRRDREPHRAGIPRRARESARSVLVGKRVTLRHGFERFGRRPIVSAVVIITDSAGRLRLAVPGRSPSPSRHLSTIARVMSVSGTWPNSGINSRSISLRFDAWVRGLHRRACASQKRSK